MEARKLAQLLRAGLLLSIYHGQHGNHDLKALVGSYKYLLEDSTRMMTGARLSYRRRAIACAGTVSYKLKGVAGKKAENRVGAPDSGTEDCGHNFGRLLKNSIEAIGTGEVYS